MCELNKGFYKETKEKKRIVDKILIISLILFIAYLVIYAFSLWPAITKGVNLAAVSGAFVSSYALIWQIYNVHKAKVTRVLLNLKTEVDNKDVIVDVSVKNIGTMRLYPQKTNIYIQEGIQEEVTEVNKDNIKAYKFQQITEHICCKDEDGCVYEKRCTGKDECKDKKRCKLKDNLENGYFCRIARECLYEGYAELGNIPNRNKEGESKSTLFPICNPDKFPDDARFANKVKYAYNCRLLSYHSLLYIAPNETFSENMVFTIPKPGYYRIIVIYTDKKWKECICKSIVVHIQ